FLDFELDEEQFEIRRGGSLVLTRRKVFDFVHHLLLHRDRVVTHDELIDALWGGAARSISTVPQYAASVRRALGDDMPQHAVIQTVRGRGYRFVAEVTESDSPSPGEVGSTRDAHRSEGVSKLRFVGRHELMSALRAAFEDSLSGETRVVMLEGDPGIGKTRVVEELCREATERGVTVLTGRCHEAEGAPAFWPWIQTMRDWMRLNEAKPVPDGLEAEGAFFSTWYRDNMGEAAKPVVDTHAAETRFRVFDGVTRGLQGFARHAPLVLVLEDMHWADPASLELLSFIGAELHHVPVFLL
ncbi:MAG: AAA family ATPase, partial [bacterium]|nr:AAA family ATPase [bacterium]